MLLQPSHMGGDQLYLSSDTSKLGSNEMNFQPEEVNRYLDLIQDTLKEGWTVHATKEGRLYYCKWVLFITFFLAFYSIEFLWNIRVLVWVGAVLWCVITFHLSIQLNKIELHWNMILLCKSFSYSILYPYKRIELNVHEFTIEFIFLRFSFLPFVSNWIFASIKCETAHRFDLSMFLFNDLPFRTK